MDGTDTNAPSGESKKPVRIAGDEELRDLVDREPLVLAEIYTRSCPGCARQEPILGIVAREFEGVVAMVDPGDDLHLMREYGVRSTPGFIRFEDGEQTGVLADGVVGTERLLAFGRGETTE